MRRSMRSLLTCARGKLRSCQPPQAGAGASLDAPAPAPVIGVADPPALDVRALAVSVTYGFVAAFGLRAEAKRVFFQNGSQP